MEYTKFTYLWPTYPEKAIAARDIGLYETLFKHVAQIKMNGTSSVIAVSPEKEIIAMTRHNEVHKAWSPTKLNTKLFRALPGKGWYVLQAELMHNKVPGIRDVNYIHEILVDNGEYLVGTKFWERQERLGKLFSKGSEEETLSHYVLDENTWLARNYTSGFTELFSKIKALKLPQYEGLVFKDPEATLAICSRPNSNASWLSKSRLATKNYNH